MTSNNKRIGWRKALYTLGITLGLGLLAYQTWQSYLAIRQYELCVLSPTYLITILGIYIAIYLVQMTGWSLIMHSLQAPLAASAVLKGYIISFLPRYIPGTVWGYLSRNEWLAQTYNIPYSVSTVASLLEASLFLVTAVAVGAYYWVSDAWKFPMLIAGVIAFALTWYALPRLANRMGGKRFQLPPEIMQGNQSRNYQMGLFVALLYLLFWALQGGALHLIGTTFCIDTPVSFFAGTAAAGLSWAIGFVILFVPAGLGVREWSLGTLLVTFTGIQPAQAALIAIVSRLAVILAEIVVILIALPRYFQGYFQGIPFRNKQERNANSP